MQKNLNYITTLPDFIEMQRVSFCWFISQGLTDELSNFSSLLDFNGNIEYIFFGQEYKLVKPTYNSLSAKRYMTNYVAQLIMPIEMRNRSSNSVLRQGKLPIANLPLMTTSATFIINGCERIIVSQIIRSPGIYFEKNKKQKKHKLTKLTLSNDFQKLRPFTKTSFGLLKSSEFSASSLRNRKFKIFGKIIRNKKFDFFKIFKIYKIITKTSNPKEKSQKIKHFLRWLKIDTNLLYFNSHNIQNNIVEIFRYCNILLDSLIKYEILKIIIEKNSDQIFYKDFLKEKKIDICFNKIETKTSSNIQKCLTIETSKFKRIIQFYRNQVLPNYLLNNNTIYDIYKNEINNKCLTLWNQRIKNYEVIINNFQEKSNRTLQKQLTQIFNETSVNIRNFNNFECLKFIINQDFSTISSLKNLFKESKKLRPILHFPLIKKYRRSDIPKNKNYFEKKDFYKNKYSKKDCYTGVLIPEYGSWVRFSFQRDKKVDIYKYQITDRFEDDIIIQIDKITKKPISIY